MKTLILMRHGQADWNADSDGQRSLTELGQEQAAHTGRALLQAGFVPQQIFCSPLLRARQSAEIAGEILGISPIETPLLDGRLSAAGLVELAHEKLLEQDGVMFVGHNPNVSLAAGLLGNNYMSFRPGDCAAFDVTDFDQPKLLFREIK